MEFFLKGGKGASVIYFNCAEFDAVTESTEKMSMVCMDGLQRLTTIRKFLNNELKVFGSYIDDYEDKAIMLRIVHIKFNINKLQTRAEILQWYIDYNSGGTVHSKEEIDRVKELLIKELTK